MFWPHTTACGIFVNLGPRQWKHHVLTRTTRDFIVAVQSLSHVRLFSTPSFTMSCSLLKLKSTESVMPSNHLDLCCSFLFLPSIFPSIRVFSKWVSSSHQIAKVLELQLQHQSFQWIFRLISFRIDWFDLLAVQGTLKSPASQFESISSLALSLLYASPLTSVHDYWKNHSFDSTDLCCQNDVSAF